MKYWLIKSEADCYSIDDLRKDKKTSWSGIRNYQARNFMKDMKIGDKAIFYHLGGTTPSAVGIAKVIKEAYPDTTAQNKKDEHFDPKSTAQNPIWYMVDFEYVETFKNPISLSRIKIDPQLEGIMLSQQGSRLSVQPVSKEHFEIIKKLGK